MRLMLLSALGKITIWQEYFLKVLFTEIYELFGQIYSRYGREDGAFSEIEPRVVVRAFIGMFIHHSLSNMLWDTEQKLLKISDEEAAREFATILLNGIKNNS